MDKLVSSSNLEDYMKSDNFTQLDVFLKKNINFDLKNYDTNFLSKIIRYCGDGIYEVESKYGDFLRAKLSKSCIFLPNENDLVEIGGIYEGVFYILSLVDSNSDTEIKINSDRLSINSGDISMASNTLDVIVKDIGVKSLNLDVNSINTNQLFSNFTISSINSSFQSTNNNERYVNSRREIYGNEDLHAINYSIKSDMTTKIQGKTTLFYGEELLRTDAKLIVTG